MCWGTSRCRRHHWCIAIRTPRPGLPWPSEWRREATFWGSQQGRGRAPQGPRVSCASPGQTEGPFARLFSSLLWAGPLTACWGSPEGSSPPATPRASPARTVEGKGLAGGCQVWWPLWVSQPDTGRHVSVCLLEPDGHGGWTPLPPGPAKHYRPSGETSWSVACKPLEVCALFLKVSSNALFLLSALNIDDTSVLGGTHFSCKCFLNLLAMAFPFEVDSCCLLTWGRCGCSHPACPAACVASSQCLSRGLRVSGTTAS